MPGLRNAVVNSQIGKWNDFDLNDGTSSFLIMVDYPGKEAEDRPLFWPSLRQNRIDWILRNFEALVRHVERVGDDTVPYLDNMTGTEIFAEAFGCRVHRASGMGSVETVTDKLVALHRMGVRHVSALQNFGMLAQPLVQQSMERMMREVIPRVAARVG